MLQVLAESQQATLSSSTLKTYVRGIEKFDLADVKEAIGDLCQRERPAGKAAMPSLAEVQNAIRQVSTRNRQRRMQQREDDYRAKVRANPENFVSLGSISKDVQELQRRRLRGEIIDNPGPEPRRTDAEWVGQPLADFEVVHRLWVERMKVFIEIVDTPAAAPEEELVSA